MRRSPTLITAALGLFACGTGPARPPGAADQRLVSAEARPRPAQPAAATPAATEPSPATMSECAPVAVPLPPLIQKDFDVPVPPLVDYSDHDQMAPFYEKLARLARHREKGRVRIAMYGDSNLTRDHISGELRRTLQKALGDGGHGYVAVGKPWAWYIHTDVRQGADTSSWKVFNMSTDQVADHLYGFAGIAAQNKLGSARAWVATAEEGAPVGTRLGHVEVFFLRRPGAGTFELSIDGESKGEIATAGTSVGADRAVFDVPDGPHRVDVTTKNDVVRLLGFVLERSAPGVVVDSLGIGGVNAELLVRGDRKLAIDTLRMRKPDLVLLLTGATEPDSPAHVEATKELVARHREALPDAPFIVMTPPDLAGGTIEHPNKSIRINRIDKQKRQAAQETRSMFWDFRGAMGGPLSIVEFAQHKMAWKDFIHLTESGGRYMGRRLAYALLRGFDEYVKKHPEAGCQNSAGSE